MRYRIVPRAAVIVVLAVGFSVGGPAVAYADELLPAGQENVSPDEQPSEDLLPEAVPDSEAPRDEQGDGEPDTENPVIPTQDEQVPDDLPLVVDAPELEADTEAAPDALPLDASELPASNGALAWVSNCTDDRSPTFPLGTLGTCDVTVTFPDGAVPGTPYEVAVADVIASRAFQSVLGYEGVGWVDYDYAICQPGTYGELVGLTSARPDASRRHGTARTLTFTYEGEGTSVSRESFLEVLCDIPTAPLIYGPTTSPDPSVATYRDEYAPQSWAGTPGEIREGCPAASDAGVTDGSRAADGETYAWIIQWALKDTSDANYTINVLDGACASAWGLTGEIVPLDEHYATAPVQIAGSTISFSSDELLTWDLAATDGSRPGVGSTVFLLRTDSGLTITAGLSVYRPALPQQPSDPDPAPEPEPDHETPVPALDDEPRTIPAPTALTEQLADTGASSSSGGWALVAALGALLGVGLVFRAWRFAGASRSA